MDIYKPSRASYRSRIKKNNKPDDTLVKLYQNSEYSQESLGLDAAEKENTAEKITAQIKNSTDFTSSGEPKKKGKEQAAKHLILRHRITRIAFASIIAIAFIIGAFIFFHQSKEQNEHELVAAEPTAPDEVFYSPLTGRLVDSANLINAPTTCVMIENSPESRPQSGLRDAGVIYESIAEGGITRFMAVYQEAKPDYIGPVRSVRLTFAELAKQYECSIAHVGGAPNALDEIRNIHNGYRDIDAFWYEGEYYWRDSSRYAPHNVYTNFERLDALNKSLGYESSSFSGFRRTKPDSKIDTSVRDATTIRINISSDTFNPVYTYDETTNSYKRSYADGSVHNDIDAEGKETQYSPDVVIAMNVQGYTRKGSTEGYQDYTTINSNEAFVFQNGTVVIGYWKRASIDEPLKFYNNDGEEIPLNRGQVWISAYPNGFGNVTWE